MANTPNPPKRDEINPATEPTPVTDKIQEVAAADPNREILKAAKKEIDSLMSKRETAANSMQQSIQQAKLMEQQSFIYRGRISVYDEQIAAIRRKHGIKETVQ